MQNLLLALLSPHPLSQQLMQPQLQRQIPPSSIPPHHSPQLQEPSISVTQRELITISAPVDLTSRTQESQEKAEQPVTLGPDQPRVDEITQQQMNVKTPSPTGSPTGTGFDSFQRFSPAAGIGHTNISGNVNNTRDDSFNVFGTGNNIYLSFAR